MKKQEVKHCEHCGSTLREWWHSLTPGLVNALLKFAKALKVKGQSSLHLQTEVELTKNEYNNFQKLQHFGLVSKFGTQGIHRSGYWNLTEKGAEFLQNKRAVNTKVKTFRDKLVGTSEELVYIKDIIKSDLEYWQKEFKFETPEPDYKIYKILSPDGKVEKVIKIPK